MRKYETIFILKPDLNDEEVKPHVEKVKNIIEKNGGEILAVDDWGKKKLAYEIKKQKYGRYLYISFNADPGTISQLDKNFQINENVLRHLNVVLERETEGRKESGESEESAKLKDAGKSSDSAGEKGEIE